MEAGHAREQGRQAEVQAQALEQEEQARSRSRSGCGLPLRRLAPLLPPGLEVLDVWSCNAPPPPPPPLPSISMSIPVAQGVAPEGTRSANQEGPGKGWGQFGSGGGDGGGSACGGWPAAASGDGEEAPAFDGAGSRIMWGRRQRAGASGEDDSAAVCSAGVKVAAAPGDLIGIAQACPALRELAIRGDPTQKAPAVPSGVR